MAAAPQRPALANSIASGLCRGGLRPALPPNANKPPPLIRATRSATGCVLRATSFGPAQSCRGAGLLRPMSARSPDLESSTPPRIPHSPPCWPQFPFWNAKSPSSALDKRNQIGILEVKKNNSRSNYFSRTFCKPLLPGIGLRSRNSPGITLLHHVHVQRL